MEPADAIAVTSNINPVPRTFLVFVDKANVLASHNVGLLGHLSSATLPFVLTNHLWESYISGEWEYRPFIEGPNGYEPNQQTGVGVSAHSLSSLSRGKYPMELVGERIRSQVEPQAPSRLSVAYAFGDVTACRVAAQMYGWDMRQVTEFELEMIPGTKVWRANMEIVSVLDGLADAGELDTQLTRSLWTAYWTGTDGQEVLSAEAGPLVERVIWEFLIEGRLRTEPQRI